MVGEYKKKNQSQSRKRPVQDKEKEGVKKKMAGKKCQHCGGDMRARGAADCVGSNSWKCRKCGRTLWIRHRLVKPPVPLTYTSKRQYQC